MKLIITVVIIVALLLLALPLSTYPLQTASSIRWVVANVLFATAPLILKLAITKLFKLNHSAPGLIKGGELFIYATTRAVISLDQLLDQLLSPMMVATSIQAATNTQVTTSTQIPVNPYATLTLFISLIILMLISTAYYGIISYLKLYSEQSLTAEEDQRNRQNQQNLQEQVKSIIPEESRIARDSMTITVIVVTLSFITFAQRGFK